MGFPSPEELIGLPEGVFWAEADERARIVVASGGPSSFPTGVEVRLSRRDGKERWALLTAHELLDAEGTRQGHEGFWVDVTERRDLQESLRRRERMSELGELVAGVAHEVRGPLSSISATVDVLDQRLGDNGQYTECASLLHSQVQRLSQLARDLLDYGRPSRLSLAPVPAAELLERAVRSCALLSREQRVQVIEGEVPEVTLVVDAARVEQALVNLLANGMQHSPRGSAVELGAAQEGDKVRFFVRDVGPGIAEEDVPRLFEPFFSRRPGGSGLGLAIAQRIAELHGGRVSALNRPEGGAEFTLLLPALSQAPRNS